MVDLKKKENKNNTKNVMMEDKVMINYEEYCKDFIEENLDGYIGTDNYGCDLAYTLTEGINRSGTATYNKYKATEYIKEWFDNAAEVYNYQVENYGRPLWNPFENPEKWMVCMIIEGCANLISQCKCVEEVWNDKVELTEELAEQIKEEIKGFSISF